MTLSPKDKFSEWFQIEETRPCVLARRGPEGKGMGTGIAQFQGFVLGHSCRQVKDE